MLTYLAPWILFYGISCPNPRMPEVYNSLQKVRLFLFLYRRSFGHWDNLYLPNELERLDTEYQNLRKSLHYGRHYPEDDSPGAWGRLHPCCLHGLRGKHWILIFNSEVKWSPLVLLFSIEKKSHSPAAAQWHLCFQLWWCYLYTLHKQ